MINTNQIVPVTALDLLTLYSVILKAANVSVAKLAGADGAYSVAANGTYLADAPVETLDFASTASAATVYFVAGYDFAGIKKAGVAQTLATAPEPDGRTLYTATLSSGSVTVAKVGL